MHFKYGTVEARIKLPNVNKGIWPAFWTLGTIGGSWPSIGEIDIMEIGSKDALKDSLGNRRVSSAAHWSHLAQMILVGSNSQVYVDNVYFLNDAGKTVD